MKHLRSGADETDSFEAETTIPGGGRIGFGVGSEADFRFDDVGTRQDVTLTASTALRYHYDASGRVDLAEVIATYMGAEKKEILNLKDLKELIEDFATAEQRHGEGRP